MAVARIRDVAFGLNALTDEVLKLGVENVICK
jgi:hypothetical protein